MLSGSWTWAYLPLAISGVSLVLATYVLPRWQRRAEARDNTPSTMSEARGQAAETAPAADADACEQMLAADLEMLQRVSQWRDARRGKNIVHRD